MCLEHRLLPSVYRNRAEDRYFYLCVGICSEILNCLLDTVVLQQKGSRNQISQNHSISRSHGELPHFAIVPHDNNGPAAQVRFKILLIKEAEQRSRDGIHPRIDQQLLDKRTFGRYETLRQFMVKFILTVCSPNHDFAHLHRFYRSNHRLPLTVDGITSTISC
jgi:hypothetical protein